MRARSLAFMLPTAFAAVVGVVDVDRIPANPAEELRPNVVLIVVDDQAEGTLDAMPLVRQRLAARGTAIVNGIIPTSTCCPSRATLLTGQYARTTGVYRNLGPAGGWKAVHSGGSEEHTLAVSLDAVGYRTGLFGKYLNGFSLAEPGYVPPGWDRFRAIFNPSLKPQLAATAYYNYDLVGTGPTEHYGSEPRDYATDVLGRAAVRFVESTPSTQPLFLYFSPAGAHAPYTPAPRNIGDWHQEPLNPAATQLTRHRPEFWPDRLQDQTKLKTLVQRQHETLMSVDEQVNAIMDALGPERVANTIFVYVSDNGVQLGEHGLLGKYVPYSGSTDVPMLVRWDGHLEAGTRDARLITNADLAATIADATNVTLENPDGVSLFSDEPRFRVVLEAALSGDHPAYCGIRTQRYTFVEYDDDQGAELYDHLKDPDELENRIANAAYATRKADLRAKAIQACSPKPPGFQW